MKFYLFKYFPICTWVNQIAQISKVQIFEHSTKELIYIFVKFLYQIIPHDNKFSWFSDPVYLVCATTIPFCFNNEYFIITQEDRKEISWKRTYTINKLPENVPLFYVPTSNYGEIK